MQSTADLNFLAAVEVDIILPAVPRLVLIWQYNWGGRTTLKKLRHHYVSKMIWRQLLVYIKIETVEPLKKSDLVGEPRVKRDCLHLFVVGHFQL